MHLHKQLRIVATLMDNLWQAKLENLEAWNLMVHHILKLCLLTPFFNKKSAFKNSTTTLTWT